MLLTFSITWAQSVDLVIFCFDLAKYFVSVRKQTASPSSLSHLPPLESVSTLPEQAGRIRTPPSPPSTSPIPSRQLWFTINQSTIASELKYAQKAAVGGLSMDLQNSDSPPWNEIECKYVHTHLIHLNLWKAPWIEWAFHFTALPEIASFHLPFWNSFAWDRIGWLPLKQGLRLLGPPINDVAALLSCTGTGREIPLVRNWYVGSWHWERLLHYFWLKPTLNIPQPLSYHLSIILFGNLLSF